MFSFIEENAMSKWLKYRLFAMSLKSRCLSIGKATAFQCKAIAFPS